MLYNLAADRRARRPGRPRGPPDLRRDAPRRGPRRRSTPGSSARPRSGSTPCRRSSTCPRPRPSSGPTSSSTYVQPVLQQSCARCHNEKYQGEFQLVEVKTRRDLTNSDIARANLDATLRLINPDDPARSELLSAGLVPHGGSQERHLQGAERPELPGPRPLGQEPEARAKGRRPRPGAPATASPGPASPRPTTPTGDGFALGPPGPQAATPACRPCPSGGGAACPRASRPPPG